MATFLQLPSGNWRVQVRRKNRYVAETFRRRKDGEEWALDIERNIDRSGSPKPRAALQVRTFGDLIDLHVEDMQGVGRPPRHSKAAVLESLKESLETVKLPRLNRERLIEFGRKRANKVPDRLHWQSISHSSEPSRLTRQPFTVLRPRLKKFG